MSKFISNKVVDAAYLLKVRDKKNVVVIDARGNMLDDGGAMYDKAKVIDWTDISLLGDFGSENLGKLLSKENYKEIFKKLKINEETEVIAYGFTMPKAGFGDEGRIIYTFDYIGHENVKFIDGGFDEIEKLGHNKLYNKENDRLDLTNLERKEATDNKASIFTEELLKAVEDEKYQIIDTRLQVEYNGRVIYGENKAGHIKNAISLPFNSLVDDKGFLKSKKEIEEILINKKIEKNKTQITYCTTGVRASYVAFILKELGYNVKNYEPSFARFCNVGEIEK